MEIYLYIVLFSVVFLAVWRSFIWRKRVRTLKQQLKNIPPKAVEKLDEIEIDGVIYQMRLEGAEKLLANGWELVYSHSLGICAKRQADAPGVPLDEAILMDYCNEAA